MCLNQMKPKVGSRLMLGMRLILCSFTEYKTHLSTFFNILCNCYCSPTDLFDKALVIPSQEGDPQATPKYSLATVPLIKQLSTHLTTQVWYSHDASSASSLINICNHLNDVGPKFGYFPN